jgi:hypothetical protein
MRAIDGSSDVGTPPLRGKICAKLPKLMLA